MCLGVPGRVVEVHESPVGMPMGRVSFSGITKEVCLAYIPDVQVDEWVVVHVGFAISRIDEEEAHRVFEYLEEMNELDEIHIPQPELTVPDSPPPPGSPAARHEAGGAGPAATSSPSGGAPA